MTRTDINDDGKLTFASLFERMHTNNPLLEFMTRDYTTCDGIVDYHRRLGNPTVTLWLRSKIDFVTSAIRCTNCPEEQVIEGSESWVHDNIKEFIDKHVAQCNNGDYNYLKPESSN